MHLRIPAQPPRGTASQRVVLPGLAIVVSLFTACATPQSYKLVDNAAARMAPRQQIVVAPIDAELAELTAGGLLERREEWTAAAVKNISDALAAETGYRPALPEAPRALKAEQDEVQALMRTLTLHRLGMMAAGGAAPFPLPPGTALTYNTGALPQHADAYGANAVLFVFIRDSFATAGRKSLLALSFLGAALTGVAVVPPMGSTMMSAALVDRDGTVIWFNHALGGGDPRTPAGARSLVHALLAGLPAAKTDA